MYYFPMLVVCHKYMARIIKTKKNFIYFVGTSINIHFYYAHQKLFCVYLLVPIY